MGIREFLDRLRSKKAKYKEFEEDMKVQEQYWERKKSANERELERYQNEAREKAIKAELEHWRKAKQHEANYENQIIKTKNMFANDKSSMLNQKSLLKQKESIFDGGNIFFK